MHKSNKSVELIFNWINKEKIIKPIVSLDLLFYSALATHPSGSFIFASIENKIFVWEVFNSTNYFQL